MFTRKTSKKPSKKPSRSDQTSFHEGELWKTSLSKIKKSKQLRMSSKKQGYPSAMQDGFAFPLFSNERPRLAKSKKARLVIIKDSAGGARKYKKTTKREKRRRRTQRRKKPKKTKKRR